MLGNFNSTTLTCITWNAARSGPWLVIGHLPGVEQLGILVHCYVVCMCGL